MKYLRILGPLLLLAIPIAIAVAIFTDSSHDYNADYEPEGDVIYSLTNPGEYGLTGDEKPGLDSGSLEHLDADLYPDDTTVSAGETETDE